MKEAIGLFAIVLAFISYTPYIKDTIKGKTKPHIYSWFVWGFVSMIVFALQLSDGGGIGSFVTLSGALIALLIFVLGVRDGKKTITKSDTFFFISALVATGFWVFAHQPILSVTLLVTIEMLGFIPTIRKAWHTPNEETLSTWGLNAIRYTLALLALQSHTYITMLYPVTWAVANYGFSIILVTRRSRLNK